MQLKPKICSKLTIIMKNLIIFVEDLGKRFFWAGKFSKLREIFTPVQEALFGINFQFCSPNYVPGNQKRFTQILKNFD